MHIINASINDAKAVPKNKRLLPAHILHQMRNLIKKPSTTGKRIDKNE
jgi:hypothetical protein